MKSRILSIVLTLMMAVSFIPTMQFGSVLAVEETYHGFITGTFRYASPFTEKKNIDATATYYYTDDYFHESSLDIVNELKAAKP